ncbi:MAG: 4-hydroxythreonine-4-phosphate dehydrogenase PdxA [Bacteroidetes bacterium]|nr:4-hydroxythreonine-4-phosphate dehydrogenase PdxA [Bacteroidota bacterium]
MSKLPVIGISIGDLNSIAPEVVLKSLHDHRILDYCVPVIYASVKAINFWKKLLNLSDLQLNYIRSIDQVNHRKINLLNVWEEEVEIKPGESSELMGNYAFLALEAACNDVLSGQLQGLVTAPLNKNTVNRPDRPFSGHTEYLAERADAQSLMVLSNEDLRVALITGHIPISEVAGKLNIEGVKQKIKLFAKALKSDFGINHPKIGVLGLNPHAGDNGLLGKEELEILIPAIDSLSEDPGYLAMGPYPADGFFGSGQFKKFDGILAVYHDQGLIPFKSLAFHDGVNITCGLPFVRTSPDHGTAYTIAGKNQANPESFRNALFSAIDLIAQRRRSEEIGANPLPMTPLKRERFRIDF